MEKYVLSQLKQKTKRSVYNKNNHFLWSSCHKHRISRKGDLSVELKHGDSLYLVGELVAKAANYRLYVCEDASTGAQGLLQIAAELEHNGGLERAAFVLRELKQISDELEVANAKLPDEKPLHYDRLFPGLLSSFVSESQGNRRINILAIKDVAAVTSMVPMSNLLTRDRLRIDLRTSAWIMGRLLKLLGLTHSQGYAVRMLSANNVVLSPKDHFMVVLDWSSVHTYQDGVPSESRKDDIAQAAQTVFAVIGGNPTTGEYTYRSEQDNRYVDLLWSLASRRENDALRAHDEFYKLVRELWGIKFYPFTTLPL
jgi:hypothetical protein